MLRSAICDNPQNVICFFNSCRGMLNSEVHFLFCTPFRECRNLFRIGRNSVLISIEVRISIYTMVPSHSPLSIISVVPSLNTSLCVPECSMNFKPISFIMRVVAYRPNPIPLPSVTESSMHSLRASCSLMSWNLSFSARDSRIPIPSSATRTRSTLFSASPACILHSRNEHQRHLWKCTASPENTLTVVYFLYLATSS